MNQAITVPIFDSLFLSLTAKQSIFLRIQVCTSSKTKGLERG